MPMHAPGPWTWNNPEQDTHGNIVINAPDGIVVARVAPRGSSPYSRNYEQREANAHLIAAAPDLLAALKTQRCSYCGFLLGVPRGGCQTCAPVVWLIAKAAEGR